VSTGIAALMPHLVVVPVLLPLATAALLLLVAESRRSWKAFVDVASTVAGLIIAISLLAWVQHQDGAAAVGVYLPANWDVPFGIVLVVDRLTALMLVLTAVISVASALYGLARWHRAGVHYHTLFQIQLMGVNGAFLTGDLFNLFVFFEVMLAASYGLLLHGSGMERVRAGLKYIAFNLLASSLFLIGVAMLYGIVGTLNFADMAQKIPHVPVADRGLLHAGAAILAIAFVAKAAMWPLGFWLAPSYAAAAPPVAALFVILTKVGVYAVLRLWTLLLSAEAGASALFGGDALMLGGLVTLAFGAVGLLASLQLRRLAGYSILVSSGTLLAVIGMADAPLIGGALFYLVGSTLASCALYLLAELIERSRAVERAPPIHEDEGDHLPFYLETQERGNANDAEDVLIGRAIPAATAFLGLSFIACALMIAGLPPLAGFLAKFAMFAALFGGSTVDGAMNAPPLPPARWILLVLLLGSGLLAMIALSRAGIRYFWSPQGRPAPRLRVIECVPVAALLLACAVLAVRGEPVLRYSRAAARGVLEPTQYIEAVMSARPVPPPTRMTTREPR
jgi:multicomponent K+:H+ antiporter subunit D